MDREPLSRALAEEVPLSISLLSELGKGSLRRDLINTVDGQGITRLLSLWPKLVLTASSPQVNDNHITVASNALCVYLNGGSMSPAAELRKHVISQDAWFAAFQCAHKAFNEGKAKPANQILETLCDLFSKLDDSMASVVLNRASLPLLKIVLLASPRSDIKKACLMLAYLHRRTPLLPLLDALVLQCVNENDYAWRQRLAEHHIRISDVSNIGKGSIPHLFVALIFAMVDLDTRSAALKLCTFLCDDSHRNTDVSNTRAVVERSIELYLERNHAALGTFAEHVLPMILDKKEKLIAFTQRYASSCYDKGANMAIFIAVLKAGRAKGILSEAEMVDTFGLAFQDVASTHVGESNKLYWFKQMLKTANPELRILTYGLLTISPAGNATVNPGVLECIASSMQNLHDDPDAHERGETLSITKRLLRRLQNSATALRRVTQLVDGDEEANIVLESYRSFVGRLYDFLKTELGTGASYPRHILAVLSLQYLFDLTKGPDLLVGDKSLVQALICLVIDPFEDVRSNAAILLRTLACKDQSLVASVLSSSLLQKVQVLAVRTGRADHADAMGRLCALRGVCATLSNEMPVDTDSTDLVEEIRRFKDLTSKQGGIELRPGCALPIHGLLLGISYRLRYLRPRDGQVRLFDFTLLEMCANVWDQVRDQLCVDSPERASEIETEADDEGPKDLLAFSWRALRDSSIVLQSLVAIVEPSRDLFHAIGSLCLDQLISLRHRGAFSTVAQTFNQCCEKIRLAADASVHGLIQEWYTVALAQIDEQANRLTRRSAGLPAMITALLSPADRYLFSRVFADLTAIAERPIDDASLQEFREVKLPQVHALNCLKDIMTNSRFSAAVVPYQDAVMELAATCLSSKIWAVRNCGLMLLRACINRLDSSSSLPRQDERDHSLDDREGKPPSMIAFHLLDEVGPLPGHDSRGTSNAVEDIFAGLDLLGHASLAGSMADVAEELVTRQLGNSAWTVREHAALLLATRFRRVSPVTAIMALLGNDLVGPENRVHGVLLCCRYHLEQGMSIVNETELELVVDTLVRDMILADGELARHSPYVYAACMDVLNDVASCILERGWSHQILRTKSFTNRIRSLAATKSQHGPYLLQRILLHETYHILMVDEDLPNESKVTTNGISQLIDDKDALGSALDVLCQRNCHGSCASLPIFLAELIDQAYEQVSPPQYVLERGFTCLARSLDHGMAIPLATAQTVSRRIDITELHIPRELRNAALKLQASLLGVIGTAHQPLPEYRRQVEAWLRVAEDSARDNLDFPSRLSAVAAVSTYIGHMEDSVILQELPGIRLRLLLLLYDLLNDDDEDIRLEAVRAGRRFKLHKMPAMDNLGYCAFAAREEVLHELKRQAKGLPELTEVALVNVLRLGHKTSSISGPTTLLETPVTSKLGTIARKLNDLFAEERQNLYIDDIREIDTWTMVLDDEGIDHLAPDVFEAVMKWTVDGLDTVNDTLENEQLKAPTSQPPTEFNSQVAPSGARANQVQLRESLHVHPLSVTYDHEILVVLLQVVSLAGVLYCHDRKAYKEQLRAKLQRAKEVCSSLAVNPVFLGAVERALSRQCR
ncbi:hypothetical protein A1O7_00825 [Cladophialophora yegresii CBS 114405]|uniref:Uncharacterized protein n=1 Tax=Cladophialophora yegresii CBS 114405 TaxID=1182544 RepID=W9X1X1_9EURO|nr:uncharacterized protein A1O7_00825 [Cladophialophora yegresii CBS 114405]EXJ64489.1 hypothetical protein A1O7_00825 [Cladophialophora yegresii CBS 114405]